MRIWAQRYWGRAVAPALALGTVAATSAFTGMATASSTVPPPVTGVVRSVGSAAQQAARAFWTSSRMAAATPAQRGVNAGTAVGPPPGTPTAKQFNGVPTVGALFLTTGTAGHFCTASVVDSSTESLILTAAHCVYSRTYATNIEFVPGYHNGRQPYGAWAVKTITVAAGWVRSKNPNLDFAFLAVTPPAGTGRPIQLVTGGLRLGINRPYRRPIEVIGYNDTGSRPVECATRSFALETDQMEFYCRDYRDGTSGGPWIIRYDSRNGTGVVFGVIGGYEQGGDYAWASYSAYFGKPARDLYLLAERQ